MVPRQGKVVQTVREKFSCRACEAITQPPAPHHAIARGRAGPGLLAMIVCDKFAMHLPLTRQSRAMAAEGIALDVSTLADWVGRACATLAPLQERIRAHVLCAERLHGDDTTVPVLARKKTVTGRIWTYVRDVSHANATGPREHGETLRRQRPAGGTLPLLPRPWRHTPGATRPGGAGYSRPTLMPASTASMRRDARRRRSPRPHAGPTAVPGSSSWPISPRPCGRRWPSRRCGASTRASPPSVVLAGCVRSNCSRRKRGDGAVEYHHNMVTAALVAPGHARAIPLAPEVVVQLLAGE